MNQGNKSELIAARLVRTPWWRTALDMLGARSQERQYRETLGRLAEREVSDTIGEEDVKSWLRMLEGESEAAPKKPQRPSRP
jgi:hypothetical protein